MKDSPLNIPGVLSTCDKSTDLYRVLVMRSVFYIYHLSMFKLYTILPLQNTADELCVVKWKACGSRRAGFGLGDS